MVHFKVFISLIFISTVFSRSEATETIPDGNYRIRCYTKSGGILALEAFVADDVVKPRKDSNNQDQKWMIQSAGDGKYKIGCWTQYGGKRFLEAFPAGDSFVRPSVEKQTQDQLWEITPLTSKDGLFRISCNTQNRGTKSIEAFPGDDIVRVKDNSLDQNQSWEFVVW